MTTIKTLFIAALVAGSSTIAMAESIGRSDVNVYAGLNTPAAAAAATPAAVRVQGAFSGIPATLRATAPTPSVFAAVPYARPDSVSPGSDR